MCLDVTRHLTHSKPASQISFYDLQRWGKNKKKKMSRSFFSESGGRKKPPSSPPFPFSLTRKSSLSLVRQGSENCVFFHPFRSISLVTQVLHFLSLHLSHVERKNFFFCAHTCQKFCASSCVGARLCRTRKKGQRTFEKCFNDGRGDARFFYRFFLFTSYEPREKN